MPDRRDSMSRSKTSELEKGLVFWWENTCMSRFIAQCTGVGPPLCVQTAHLHAHWGCDRREEALASWLV